MLCNLQFCLCDFSKFFGNLNKRKFQNLGHFKRSVASLVFKWGNWSRESLNISSLSPRIKNTAELEIRSWAVEQSRYLPYKSILPTGTPKGIMKDMFLWVGRCLCYTDLITWPLAAQPFGVLRKWLLIMTAFLGLVILIFTVFLKSQILDAEASFLFKLNLNAS